MSNIGLSLLSCLFLITSCVSSQRHGYRSVASVAKMTRNCARNPSRPTLIFTEENPCNPNTNCRYGAICWRSTILTPHRDLISADELHSSKPLAPIESTACRCVMHCRTYPRRLSNIDAEKNMVCGSDGRTYQNECKLRLAACRCQFPITIRWKGSCENGPWKDPSQSLALDLEMEGSGSGNLCEEGIVCKYGAVCDIDSEDGPCLCKMDCYDTTALTVCGSDGRSYYNQCYLEEASCQEQRDIIVSYKGSCQSEKGAWLSSSDKEDDKCGHKKCLGNTIDPQCGSNGLSYPNRCSLEVEACEKNLDIHVIHSGHCDVTDQDKPSGDPCENIFCLSGACIPNGPNNYECVCEALCNQESLLVQQNSLNILKDFTTHNELTQLMKQFGVDQQIDQLELHFSPKVTASPISVRELPAELEEPIIESLDHVEEMKRIKVVGNKGKVVYNGEIPMKFYGMTHNDKLRKRKDPKRREIRSTHQHNYVNETVCGTDGVTYTNECQLRIHSCYEKNNVKVKKIGACPYFINPLQSEEGGITNSEVVTTTMVTEGTSKRTTPEKERVTEQGLSTTLFKELYSEETTTSEIQDTYVDEHTSKAYEVTTNTELYDIATTEQSTLVYVKNYVWIIAVAIVVQLIILVLAGLLYKKYRKKKVVTTSVLQKDETRNSVETMVTIS